MSLKVKLLLLILAVMVQLPEIMAHTIQAGS